MPFPRISPLFAPDAPAQPGAADAPAAPAGEPHPDAMDDAQLDAAIDKALDASGYDADDAAGTQFGIADAEEDDPAGDRVAALLGKPTTPQSTPAVDSGAEPGQNQDVPQGVNPADWQRATRALERDDLPKAVMDQLRKDPAELVRYGLKRAGVHAEIDGYGQRVRDLESRAGGREQRSGADPSQVDGEPTSTANVAGQPSKLRDLFADAGLGEDEGERLEAAIEAQIEARVQAQLQPIQDQRAQEALASARQHAAKLYPELSNDDAQWEGVKKAMLALGRAGEFTSLESLAEAAAHSRLAATSRRGAAAAVADEFERRQAGQPIVHHGREKPVVTRASSQDEYDDIMAEAALQLAEGKLTQDEFNALKTKARPKE